jgi:hypothetical protein
MNLDGTAAMAQRVARIGVCLLFVAVTTAIGMMFADNPFYAWSELRDIYRECDWNLIFG